MKALRLRKKPPLDPMEEKWPVSRRKTSERNYG